MWTDLVAALHCRRALIEGASARNVKRSVARLRVMVLASNHLRATWGGALCGLHGSTAVADGVWVAVGALVPGEMLVGVVTSTAVQCLEDARENTEVKEWWAVRAVDKWGGELVGWRNNGLLSTHCVPPTYLSDMEGTPSSPCASPGREIKRAIQDSGCAMAIIERCTTVGVRVDAIDAGGI